mmetsp:Transcript_33840/g.44646  ORF Transcript_33840/g.44646 Transcript_33840/m.44646 type:complete len:120 (+) Transcript_33840:163-522(+)
MRTMKGLKRSKTTGDLKHMIKRTKKTLDLTQLAQYTPLEHIQETQGYQYEMFPELQEKSFNLLFDDFSPCQTEPDWFLFEPGSDVVNINKTQAKKRGSKCITRSSSIAVLTAKLSITCD